MIGNKAQPCASIANGWVAFRAALYAQLAGWVGNIVDSAEGVALDAESRFFDMPLTWESPDLRTNVR